MDPVTAFGLAAGVVQFVHFSDRLLNSSVKIYKESNHSDSQAESLDAVCARLKSLSTKLSMPTLGVSFSISQNDITLRDLAALCQKDCDALLAKLADLRSKTGHTRFWKSFREALKDGSGMTQDSFRQLQERLKTYESSMSLHMCASIIESGEILHAEISGVRKEHQVHKQLAMTHDGRLADIEKHISEVLKEIRVFNTASRPDRDTGDQLGRLITQLEGLSVQNLDIRQTEQIIASLKYPQRPTRHENIPEAHRETFEWALKHPLAEEAKEAPHSKAGQGNILQWIRTGNGLFWVSGKPGSGKSTFMKFLADHHQVRLALSSWAAPQPILVAVHYFWNSGTMMQNSERGLWQSILYDILRQAPEIAPDVCKRRWIDSPHAHDGDLLGASKETPWSVSELRECLLQVVRQTITDIRLCIFIDGLDESQVDHLDLVMFLTTLCRSSAIKLCVSSRPWNVFEQSFGRSALSKIYMHELTGSDILNYTRSRLGEHPNWSDTIGPNEGEMLVEAVTIRASGVFLWVFLVTKLLREGLTNGDTFNELQVMLESFPPELEPFYKQMLDSVPSVYHHQMSGFLEIANSYNDLDLRIYYYYEMEYKDIDFALNEAVMPIDEDEYRRIRSRMVVRFDAICKGLLEISDDQIVVFIHRTVRDWSATEPVRKYLSHKMKPGFNTTLSALRATLACFKHPLWISNRYTLIDPTVEFFSLAAEISHLNDHESQHAKTANRILDSFVTTENELVAQGLSPSQEYSTLSLQSLLIVGGFWDYLDAKLEESDEYFATLSRKPDFFVNHSFQSFDPAVNRRGTCTSDREARVRSRVTRKLLSSVLRQSIPPFRRCTSQIREDESVSGYINSALRLSRLLVSFGTDPITPRIPTVSSTSTETEVQAWAGVFMLPFTEYAQSLDEEYSRFLHDLGPEILNGGDFSLMLLQYDTELTIWDLLCEQVRALSTKAIRCEESPQEMLVWYVIEKFSKSWWKLPGAREKLRAAIHEGFPTQASRRLIAHMDKDYSIDQGDSHVTSISQDKGCK